MSEHIISGVLPILALRGLAVFPDQTIHFDVGRVKSLKALEEAMKSSQTILLIPQKSIVDDDPGLDALYPVGCVCRVKQVLKAHGDNLRVLVTGLCRARIVELRQSEPYLSGLVESLAEIEYEENIRTQALRREANALYGAYLDMSEHPGHSIQLKMIESNDTGYLADCIAQNSGMDYADKAKLLCQLHPVRRLESAIRLLRREVEMLNLEARIQERTKANIDQNQKEYYLREQMKAIREELGEGDDISEFSEYERQILLLKLEQTWEQKLLKDLDRLK